MSELLILPILTSASIAIFKQIDRGDVGEIVLGLRIQKVEGPIAKRAGIERSFCQI